MQNPLKRFDPLIKMACLPGVLDILKREEMAKTVTMLLATLLGNEREKTTKDKRPNSRAHLHKGPDSCGVWASQPGSIPIRLM